MALAKKTAAPALVDIGNYEDIHTSGIAKIDFLSRNSVRLVCFVWEDEEHTTQRVVAKCIWEVDDLLDVAEQVKQALAARGYVRQRLTRVN